MNQSTVSDVWLVRGHARVVYQDVISDLFDRQNQILERSRKANESGGNPTVDA